MRDISEICKRRFANLNKLIEKERILKSYENKN